MAQTNGPSNAGRSGESAQGRFRAPKDSMKDYFDTMWWLKRKYNKADAAEQRKMQEDAARYQNKLDIENEKAKHKLSLKNIKEQAQLISKTADNIAVKLGASVVSGLSSVLQTTSKGIDNFVQEYQKYQTQISTRLQGSDLTYSNLQRSISQTVGTSPLVSQTKVLSNLAKLIEQGISYNVEQRAFLATVSDKIANTFNAFDSNLLRLIRIQQADTTASRLGIESALTKFLNANFSDTSYLTDIRTGSISSLLTNAESLMGYQGGSEFDYAVQKWLGSLYSVGVSSGTISSIASGINALATGDISALSGSPISILLAMAAQRQGLSYGSLIGNLRSSADISSLLSGIVGLGTSLTGPNISNVTRTQYANMLGMSISDLIALSNLTASDLSKISSDMLSYQGTLSETAQGISTMGTRMSLTDKIDTLLENALTNIGARIATNEGLYGTWQVANILQKTGISEGISSLVSSALPFGMTVDPVAMLKGGIAGYSTIAELLSVINNLGQLGGTFNLSALGAKDVLRQGIGTTGIVMSGVTTGTSGLMTIGGQSPWLSGTDVAQYQGETPSENITDILQDKVTNQLNDIYSMMSGWDNFIRNLGV